MISKLALQGFRNLETAELGFHAGTTVVTGRNGQGKTNLLEAIHWVTQGWSFRSRSFEPALRFGTDECWLRMEGSVHGGRPHRQALWWRKGELSTKVNDEEFRTMAGLHGHLHAVLLGPEDIALVKEGPERRRRWLDVLVAETSVDGLELLQRYRRLLLQRNRWLKDRKGGTVQAAPAEWTAFEVLTEELARHGGQIMARRLDLLQRLAPEASRHYAELSCEAEEVAWACTGSVHPPTGLQGAELATELQGKLQRKMTAMRSVELAQGITCAGPHKDDVLLTFRSGATLRETGSQGQCRTAALAMGLVALDVALGADTEPPILLLDDIFAELDAERRSALANLIRTKKCQVFAATPRAEDLPFSADDMLHVKSGAVSRA